MRRFSKPSLLTTRSLWTLGYLSALVAGAARPSLSVAQEPDRRTRGSNRGRVRREHPLAADLDWMQTARVFLIDAYEPPFAAKLEFDAKALAETMAHMNANTVRIATMGKYALIPGVRFTPHPELGSRDILAETIAACKPRGIRVVPYVSTGHKLAWTMVTRDYPEYAQRTSPGGGPARSHMFVGEDHGTVCWNTPYRQAYLDLVERLVRDYDIDGIYFDTGPPATSGPDVACAIATAAATDSAKRPAWSCRGTKKTPTTRPRNSPRSTATAPGTRTRWPKSLARCASWSSRTRTSR